MTSLPHAAMFRQEFQLLLNDRVKLEHLRGSHPWEWSCFGARSLESSKLIWHSSRPTWAGCVRGPLFRASSLIYAPRITA